MIRDHPLTGVGVGSFTSQLAEQAQAGEQIEPVHNLPLLASAELGILGFILMIGLFISIAQVIGKVQSPKAILMSATLVGLGITSLFDHNLWSLAPGRILLGLVLGLWAGQIGGNGE